MSPLPSDTPEGSGRVRTNSEAARGKTINLFHSGRHNWLGKVNRDRKLPGGAQRVATLIWEHINQKTGYAWPSIPYIADKLELHRTTVMRSIAALERRGWLTVQRRIGKHGGNRYRIAFGLADVGGR